ncbi:MAG: transcription termination factor NusA [Flavobacteriales bacterium]|nr:transcription termination factor NusA [Flavobacteriales bacterium]MDC1352711.1 transcription termination factor NusA [Flavobacteriales bacterium]|tara:strand:- start:15422 stop:16657 length:1236 start_codon:yes stop_codon:yes gene_type:complete
MDSINLIDSFAEFKEFKNIDRVTMMGVLEEVFRAMVRKANGTDDNVDVIINVDKGDLELWINKEIVKDGEVEDPALEIELSKALKIEADFEVGEEIAIEVKIEDFGRRNILALRQNLINKVMELEKDNVFKKYKDKIGELLTGEVYQIWKREMLILDEEGNELILPKSEQIPGDFFKKGDTIRTVVERVDHTNNSPKIILSRTSGAFLERLFELEIPEIFDGLITIKKIVRTPGDRAKVAVESYDDRVDPVGACVGMKGARIHGIVRELRNENIDVINYTENVKLLIQRALSPAKVGSVELVEDTGRANVYLHPDEVSKAIGRGGQNIKLAGKLTGYEIDVYREGAEDIEDVDLGEFADEIESWVIDELKAIGCDSAKSVLAIGKEDLIKRTDLEDETIDDVLKVLKSEFE